MSTEATDTPDIGSVSALKEYRIYSHSPLLYWWPVWAIGFLMALWTYVDHHHMVIVPPEAVVNDGVLTAPAGTDLTQQPLVHVARSRLPGVIFVITLLVVAVLGNVWIRGPWAVATAAFIAAVVLLVSWMDWWDPLVEWFRLLHVHINLGGYLVISTVLFIAWVLTVFVFDRWTYLIFSVGQVRLRSEVGDAEMAFDTSSVTFEKKPYDYFRWLIGLGAGDMIVRTGGPNGRVFELSNVIGLGRWMHRIEERMRLRDVV